MGRARWHETRATSERHEAANSAETKQAARIARDLTIVGLYIYVYTTEHYERMRVTTGR